VYHAAVDESTYLKVCAETFRAIEDAFEDVDPDAVELTSTGDVLTFRFANGVRCILNTQRPARQLWLAAKDSAWHFDWDSAGKKWIDDRGRGVELRGQLARIVKEQAGLDVTL
jgi:CyaY protein